MSGASGETLHPDKLRCPNCGATEFGSFEIWDGWHVYPEHHSDCDGSCRDGFCPVPIQCGPLPLTKAGTP